MNSIMMIPQKTDYTIDEQKKVMLKEIEKVRVECASDIKELRSYIHTLHTDI